MNNRVLINEVSRIHQLMGIKPQENSAVKSLLRQTNENFTESNVILSKKQTIKLFENDLIDTPESSGITDTHQITKNATEDIPKTQQTYTFDTETDFKIKPIAPLDGKKTNEQTLETTPKNTQSIGFGNESNITETFSRNTNYQNKIRKIYGKMFSFMKDSQKKYLDVIDDVERTNMENFKRSLMRRRAS